jgi:HK97 family phage portal protein
MLDGIRKFFGWERRDFALTDAALLELFGGRPTAAGVSVTAATALRSPTALACTRAISETLGALPLHVYRRTADGRERVTDHPAAKLLAGDWAPWESGVSTRTQLQVDAILHGAGYGLVLRAGGQPKEIHRLDSAATTCDTSGPEPRFKVRLKDGERVYPWQDIVVIRTPGGSAARPLCIVDLAREAIGVDLVMAEHQAKLFSNGARPSGVLKTGSQKLSDEAFKRLRASWQAMYSGGENAGKTAILEAGMDFEQLAFSSVDAQFLELRKLAATEIAKAYRVPGTLAGDLDRATWKNVPELNQQFVSMCLLPWGEVWTAALSRCLLSPAERDELYIELIPDDLMRGDITARFTAYRQAAGGSWLTPNEVRKRENLPAVEGGDELIKQAGQGAGGDPAAEPTPQDSPKLKVVS